MIAKRHKEIQSIHHPRVWAAVVWGEPMHSLIKYLLSIRHPKLPCILVLLIHSSNLTS